MKSRISLVDMAPGQEGSVVEVHGGRGLVRRLDPMGIRPGAGLVKTSGPHMRGPVTVRIGNAQVAVGYGMASKIIVEVEAKEPS